MRCVQVSLAMFYSKLSYFQVELIYAEFMHRTMKIKATLKDSSS